MSAECRVTYVRLAMEADASPLSEDLLAQIPLGDPGPVIVQRWLLETSPLPLPRAPTGLGTRGVEDTWVTDLQGLARALEADVVADLGRLVARIPWPLTPSDEAMLLLARFQHPGLRLAVRLPPAAAEEVFYYLDCLGLPWLALPESEGPLAEWTTAMRRLLRLWLFEPRTCTPMEPILSAFRIFCLSLRTPVPWLLRLVDRPRAGPAVVSPWRPWTPSLHAALVAGSSASIDPSADEWTHDLPRLCGELDGATLAALAPAVVPSPRQ